MYHNNLPLRPESGPVPYDSLITCQVEALEKITDALYEAKQLVLQPEAQGSSTHLVDADRVNRIFFVSGEPGSGKSSLYLTLQDILDRKPRKPSQNKVERKLSDKAIDDYTNNVTKLKSLIGSVHWLEQIDLEVTGDEGENLLAAVLVRITQALGEWSSSGSNACMEAMNNLEVLANDIGIAWDGNLQARASSLDPASYSQEVMERTTGQTWNQQASSRSS